MKIKFLDDPVYIVTLYKASVLEEAGMIDFKERIILGLHKTEEQAIRCKEYFQEKADENGFGDIDKYYVETWGIMDGIID